MWFIIYDKSISLFTYTYSLAKWNTASVFKIKVFHAKILIHRISSSFDWQQGFDKDIIVYSNQWDFMAHSDLSAPYSSGVQCIFS